MPPPQGRGQKAISLKKQPESCRCAGLRLSCYLMMYLIALFSSTRRSR